MGPGDNLDAAGRLQTDAKPMADTSFPRDRIRITLLENAHPAAAAALTERGYAVEVIPRALEGDELCKVMAASHVVGVGGGAQAGPPPPGDPRRRRPPPRGWGGAPAWA